MIFQGENTNREVGSFLFNEHHKGATVIAHNMRGYDGYFLLNYLIQQSIQPNNIVYNGSKIMFMTIGKGLDMKVIDSLNFLPMKLSQLPKSFGFTELKKGWFPHFFNKVENQNYVRPLPHQDFYGVKYMSSKERETFMQWYTEHKDDVFDFRKEIKEYCQSDVTILLKASMEFRNLLLKSTTDDENDKNVDDENPNRDARNSGVDPFQFTTIASVCMGIYKNTFL